MNKILGNTRQISVSQNTKKLRVWIGGCLLKSGVNFFTSARLDSSDSKINHGDVGCWDTNCHSSKLAVKFRQNLSYSLGGTCTGRDHIG